MPDRSSERGQRTFDGDITLPFRIVCTRKEESDDAENRRGDEADRGPERGRSEDSRD